MATQTGNLSAATQNAGGDTDDSVGDGSYVILISVDGQGRILVGVEGGADTAASDDGDSAATGATANAGGQSSGYGAGSAATPAAGNGSNGAESGAGAVAMAPARNIKDALTQALEIYKNNGQVSQSNGDADFNAGFDGDSGASGDAANRSAAGAGAAQ